MAYMYIQLPVFPMMVLSDPTCTLAAPEILPWTKMTAGPAALAAVVSSPRVFTVTCAALPPPVVLLMLDHASDGIGVEAHLLTLHSGCNNQCHTDHWLLLWRAE